MDKTIKQIAEELGVSKQAVHQKRKSKLLSSSLQPFTSIVDGTVYISIDGQNLLKQAFNQDNNKTVDDKLSSTVDSNVYTVLKQTIDILTLQLESKDKQIAELQKLLDQQQQLQLQQIISPVPKKKSLVDILFKRK